MNLILADDHDYFLDGLEMHLLTCPEIENIYRAANGAEILDLLAKKQADSLLTDIRMPVMDGIATVQEIGQQHRDIAIGVITEYYDVGHIKPLWQAGVSIILDKRFIKYNIPKALKVLQVKGTFYSELIMPVIQEIERSLSKTEGLQIPTPQLTKKEKQILPYLAKGLSNNEIARIIERSSNTIDTHRSNIYSKFSNAYKEKINNAAKLAQKARISGMIK